MYSNWREVQSKAGKVGKSRFSMMSSNISIGISSKRDGEGGGDAFDIVDR